MKKYRDIFEKQNGFFRSTRLDLDKMANNTRFIVTPLFIHILNRVVDGIINNGPRAISITGPYGTGKSTTVLEVLHLLESESTKINELRDQYPNFHWPSTLPKVFSIPVIGIPGALGANIKNSIYKWAISVNDSEFIKQINEIDSSDLDAIVELIDILRNKYNDRSLILVIDELGKHLEYAANHPDTNDIYLLQLIAEYAERTSHPKMSFITILHQAFENYSNKLLRTQRDEFAKIQGRFEDIAFQIPIEYTLKIIGAAISNTCRDDDLVEPARKVAEQIGKELYDIGVISHTIPVDTYLTLCRQCAPLHPITALLIGPMFRNFAQNERSLFSFLGSYEPFGFQSFLDETEYDPSRPKLYGLSELYEYVTTSLGSSIYNSTYGRRWAIIETALDRIPDNRLTAKDLIKAIGLISAVPTQQLIASKRVLELLSNSSIDEDISYLTNRSIVVYRRFSNSYRLWDGSDIDIEALIEEARKSSGIPPLIESITSLVPPRPIVARKHSMETGALRWFEVTYLSKDQIKDITKESRPKNADGKIYIVISSIDDELPASIPDLKNWQLVVWITIPPSVVEAVNELYFLKKVIDNTPSLLDDEVARREIYERQRQLEQYIDRALSGTILRPEGTVIVFDSSDEKPKKLEGKEINNKVSKMCDDLYNKAPRIVNEFVNRNILTSTATAARNDVLRRMIEHVEEENLGIVGYPPQLPIYLSTLKLTGLHKQLGDKWAIVPPEERSVWFDSWNFLKNKVGSNYCSISEIWTELSLPPYGIRKGLLPILTVAFMVAYRNQLSILENDFFVPELSMAIVERILRNPEHFKIRLNEISGSRRRFIELMVNNGALSDSNKSSDLLSLVRPLIVFAHRLPEFTKTTNRISTKAAKVRSILLNAKEPSILLFDELPSAVGFSEINESVTEDTLHAIVMEIVNSVRELARCYPSLLDQIKSSIFEVFGLSSLTDNEAIKQLRHRASLLYPVINGIEIKSVTWRMMQEEPVNQWVESVASVIMKKTPRNWLDNTLEEFRIKLLLLERHFAHYETIASFFERNTSNKPNPIRIGITTPEFDFETVINLSESDQNRAKEILVNLLSQLDSTDSKRGNQMLYIASELVRMYYTGSHKKEDIIRG